MSSPDLVVGTVAFGNDFGSSAELEFYRAEDKRNLAEVASLRAANRTLIKRNNRLVRVLRRCAALSEEVANERHEALLAARDPL